MVRLPYDLPSTSVTVFFNIRASNYPSAGHLSRQTEAILELVVPQAGSNGILLKLVTFPHECALLWLMLLNRKTRLTWSWQIRRLVYLGGENRANELRHRNRIHTRHFSIYPGVICWVPCKGYIWYGTWDINGSYISCETESYMILHGNRQSGYEFGSATAAKCSREAVRMKDEVSFECCSTK